MTDSTPRRAKKKPAKPRPDFPLFPHATGRWAKKVRGRFCYFGKVADDPNGEAALRLWLDQRDDLLAGRIPRAARDGLTLADLANRFLTDRRSRVDSGELTERSWHDYFRMCDRLLDTLGKHRLVEDVRPEDFATVRKMLAKRLGPAALSVQIARIRVLFNYGYQNELIDKPVRFGTALERPPKRLLRQVRNDSGHRMYEAAEIHKLLAVATPMEKAWLLLGINCALGPADVGRLTEDELDLDKGWLTFPRPKTGISRSCPLWSETIAAIRDVLAKRPPPQRPEVSGRVFLTRAGGPWFTDGVDEPIVRTVRRLLKRAGVYSPGRGLYGLRRSFRTIADECKDQPAADFLMGHVDNSMAEHYRERIGNSRLVAVVQHVHGWLFRGACPAKKPVDV